jgi:ABC-type multidrug transport system ATPase subunit
MKRERSAVFFTTHSIEEAEALSTKIGIMVKGGEIKCIGTSQEIKGKFGFGYVIDCKIALLGSENQLLTYLCLNFG